VPPEPPEPPVVGGVPPEPPVGVPLAPPVAAPDEPPVMAPPFGLPLPAALPVPPLFPPESSGDCPHAQAKRTKGLSTNQRLESIDSFS
jgi:hypothetical protein